MRFSILMVALLLLGVAAGCNHSTKAKSEQAEVPTQLPLEAIVDHELLQSHQAMLAELDKIRVDAKENHKFFGERPLREAKRILEEEGPAAAPLDLSTMEGMLGQELLRLGRTKEAVEHMTKAVKLLEENRDKITVDLL